MCACCSTMSRHGTFDVKPAESPLSMYGTLILPSLKYDDVDSAVRQTVMLLSCWTPINLSLTSISDANSLSLLRHEP